MGGTISKAQYRSNHSFYYEFSLYNAYILIIFFKKRSLSQAAAFARHRIYRRLDLGLQLRRW
jgi:hypothetical protein